MFNCDSLFPHWNLGLDVPLTAIAFDEAYEIDNLRRRDNDGCLFQSLIFSLTSEIYRQILQIVRFNENTV